MQLIDAVTVVKVHALGSDEEARHGPDARCLKTTSFILPDAPVFTLCQAHVDARAME